MLGIEPTVRAREGKGEEEKSRISVGVHSQRRRKGRKKERKRKVFGYQRSLNPQRRRKRREKEGKRWVSVELEWSTKEKKGKIERKEQKWWVSVGLEPDLNLLYSPVSYWTCIYITCDADTNTSFSVLLHTALQTWSIWPESNKREQNHTTHTHTHKQQQQHTQCLCLPSNALRHDIKVFAPSPPVLNLLWKLQFFYRITVIRHHFQKYMISSCILHSYSISDIQKLSFLIETEVKLCVHIHLDTWSKLHMPTTGYIANPSSPKYLDLNSPNLSWTICMNSVGRTSNSTNFDPNKRSLAKFSIV